MLLPRTGCSGTRKKPESKNTDSGFFRSTPLALLPVLTAVLGELRRVFNPVSVAETDDENRQIANRCSSPSQPFGLAGEFGSRYRFSLQNRFALHQVLPEPSSMVLVARKGEGSPEYLEDTQGQGPGCPFFLGTFSLHPKGTLSLRSGGQAKKKYLGHPDQPGLVVFDLAAGDTKRRQSDCRRWRQGNYFCNLRKNTFISFAA